MGKRFGRLVVIGTDGVDRYNYKKWLCQCDCGKTRTFVSYWLIRGVGEKSCGCASHDILYKGIESLQNFRFCNYKDRARRKGLEFSLSVEYFIKTTSSPCYYCGSIDIVHHFSRKKDLFEINGIDRINSSEGYTEKNTVPCCKFCNYAKKDKSLDDFMSWVNRLIKFQSEKGQK